MKSIYAIGLCLALAACGSNETEADTSGETSDTMSVTDFDPNTAELATEATPMDENRVKFVITTNLPTPVEVMASVNLAGQAPDDVYIGHNERITLSGERTEYVLDTSKAREPLPSGEYEAEVSFYPRWGADNGNPAAKAAPELEATDTLTLGGSGESRADAERRNDLQRWVMGNISMNVPWDRARYEARLGSSRKGPSTKSHLHDAYYFPDADMTFLVNRFKNEITVWRLGDVTE